MLPRNPRPDRDSNSRNGIFPTYHGNIHPCLIKYPNKRYILYLFPEASNTRRLLEKTTISFQNPEQFFPISVNKMQFNNRVIRTVLIMSYSINTNRTKEKPTKKSYKSFFKNKPNLYSCHGN